MKRLIFPMKFITPAFIAGANQNEPEIRSASIRGAIRWWFRVVGGTKAEEDELFGFARKTNGASKVTIRVVNPVIVNNERDLPCTQNTIPGYLIYFASVSGNDQDIIRTKARHYIGCDSTFILEVLERYPIKDSLWKKLLLALDAFCVFGTLGLRATRGFGKVALQSPKTWDEVMALSKELKAVGVYLFTRRQLVDGNGQRIQAELGMVLKDVLRKTWSSKTESALGSSTPRSSSALQLCPVVIKGQGIRPFFLYTDNACSYPSLRTVLEGDTMPRLDAKLRTQGYEDVTSLG